MNYVNDIFSNTALISAVVAWAIAQALKVLTHLILYKEVDFKRVFGAGGMPSSHTAMFTALTYTVYELQGLASVEFAMCMCVLFITMYDAAGVRREAGLHASLLNIIVDEWEKRHGEITDKNLKEIIGHTPIEVLGGLILGLLVGIIIQ